MPDAVIGSAAWTLEVYDKGFKSGLATAKAEMEKFGKTMQEQDKGMGSMMKQVKALATGYVGLKVVQGVTEYMRDSVKQFQEAEAVYNKLSNTILNQEGATQKNVDALVAQSEALAKVSTMDDAVIQAGQAQIASFNGMTAVMVEKLTPAWMDYTVKEYGMVVSTEQARQSATGMTKALMGQYDVLTKQGFKLDEVQKKILETGTMEERVTVITEAMSYAQGAAAAAAETWQGKQIRLTNQLDEGKKAIGGVAMVVGGTLIDAMIGGGQGMAAFGDNALQIAKQIGEAFLLMGKSVLRVMAAIMGGANLVGASVGQLAFGKENIESVENMTDANNEFLNILIKRRTEIEKSNKSDEEKAVQLKKISEQISNINSNVKSVFDDAANPAQKQLDDLIETEGNIGKTIDSSITKLKSLSDIKQLFAPGTGGANVNMDPFIKGDSDGAKKAEKDKQDALQKTIDFRRKELDMGAKIKDLYAKQKIDLAELKVAYDKAIQSINENLAQLKKAYDASSRSAKESFMSSLASSAASAEQAIKDKKAQIQAELNNGDQADQSKIAKLQEQINIEQGILDEHADDISAAKKAEEDSKTALGVKNLYDRYAEERKASEDNYAQQKASLENQLSETKTSYAKNQKEIKDNTIKSIADIQKQYTQMFDDLTAELVKIGNMMVGLLNLGNKIIPGVSGEATKEWDKFLKNIKPRALGGPISAGMPYLVGENGPEVIVPRSSGTIIPNGGGTFNFYISEKVDMQYVLEQVNAHLGNKSIQSSLGIS